MPDGDDRPEIPQKDETPDPWHSLKCKTRPDDFLNHKLFSIFFHVPFVINILRRPGTGVEIVAGCGPGDFRQ
jgi:hypothetical protein